MQNRLVKISLFWMCSAMRQQNMFLGIIENNAIKVFT